MLTVYHGNEAWGFAVCVCTRAVSSPFYRSRRWNLFAVLAGAGTVVVARFALTGGDTW